MRLVPIIADTEEPLPADMERALILLEAEYARDPSTLLGAEDVRAFIRTTEYAHVADDFEEHYLLWAF